MTPRTLAAAYIRNSKGLILVQRDYDPFLQIERCGPLTAPVLFQQELTENLQTKFAEELKRPIICEKLYQVKDCIYEYMGAVRHDILLIYKAKFINREDYNFKRLPLLNDNGPTSFVEWGRDQTKIVNNSPEISNI